MASPNAQMRGFEVIARETNEVVHFVDCHGKNDAAMNRVEAALANRTDLDKFFIRQVGR